MDYNELAEEFMRHLHMLHRARPHKQMNESMQGEAFVLQYLSMHEGSALPSEISNVMEISSARVAAALNGMERKGMITRQIDPSDRRRILVNLTADGLKLAEERRQEVMRETSKLLSMLGEEDAREYVRITIKLVEQIYNGKYKE